jgi:hypothetical protein
MTLTKAQRTALERYVFDGCMSSMFGDGMESDYIMGGFPTFKGIRYMSDDELFVEACDFSDKNEVKKFLRGIK